MRIPGAHLRQLVEVYTVEVPEPEPAPPPPPSGMGGLTMVFASVASAQAFIARASGLDLARARLECRCSFCIGARPRFVRLWTDEELDEAMGAVSPKGQLVGSRWFSAARGNPCVGCWIRAQLLAEGSAELDEEREELVAVLPSGGLVFLEVGVADDVAQTARGPPEPDFEKTSRKGLTGSASSATRVSVDAANHKRSNRHADDDSSQRRDPRSHPRPLALWRVGRVGPRRLAPARARRFAHLFQQWASVVCERSVRGLGGRAGRLPPDPRRDREPPPRLAAG